jgi:Domain of unknown function (DUF932)
MSNIILAPETSFTGRGFLTSVPLPKETKSYSPVPHKVVIETILEEMDKANIKVVSENYISGRDGKQAEMHYQLAGGDKEMAIRLIAHNSYDKTMPLRVALGAHVFICRNGMVVGDMGTFKRKHTGSVLEDFKQDMGMHIERAGETFKRMRKDRERMKEIEMTKRTTSELMGRLFLEEAIITSTQLNIIKREIENPSFNYGIEGSLWNDYNAVTVALRDSIPSQNMKQHIQLHEFIQKEYQLVS